MIHASFSYQFQCRDNIIDRVVELKYEITKMKSFWIFTATLFLVATFINAEPNEECKGGGPYNSCLVHLGRPKITGGPYNSGSIPHMNQFVIVNRKMKFLWISMANLLVVATFIKAESNEECKGGKPGGGGPYNSGLVHLIHEVLVLFIILFHFMLRLNGYELFD